MGSRRLCNFDQQNLCVNNYRGEDYNKPDTYVDCKDCVDNPNNKDKLVDPNDSNKIVQSEDEMKHIFKLRLIEMILILIITCITIIWNPPFQLLGIPFLIIISMRSIIIILEDKI